MMGRRIRNGTAAVALVVCVVLAALNLRLAVKPMKQLLAGKKSPKETAEAIAENYRSDDLIGKYPAITLNGLFTRLSGRRVYNEVTLLNNGALTGRVSTATNPLKVNEKDIDRVADLASMAEKFGSAFLYVQRPYKEPLEGGLFPAGTRLIDTPKAEMNVAAMKQRGINTLDLIPLISATVEDSNRNFYRTDHHWNADGALKAYGYILQAMEEALGVPLDKSSADPENWERHELKNWWIGSRGKRVGPLFAGTDSLIWYTPKFETGRISRANLKENGFISGSFEDACMRLWHTESQDFYNHNDYYVYIGSDGTVHSLRNDQAPNKLRVLMIKSSYGIPILAYLATAFTEVDSLDPRYYTASTVAQYIDWTKPDIVMVVSNESILDNECVTADQDGEKQKAWREAHREMEEVLRLEDLRIEARAEKRNAVTVGKVEKGKVYRLRLDQVTVDQGETEGISVNLAKKGEKNAADCMVFDIAYCNRHGYEWTFAVPEDKSPDAEYELQICAGVYGKTEQIGITCHGLVLQRE